MKSTKQLHESVHEHKLELENLKMNLITQEELCEELCYKISLSEEELACVESQIADLKNQIEDTELLIKEIEAEIESQKEPVYSKKELEEFGQQILELWVKKCKL